MEVWIRVQSSDPICKWHNIIPPLGRGDTQRALPKEPDQVADPEEWHLKLTSSLNKHMHIQIPTYMHMCTHTHMHLPRYNVMEEVKDKKGKTKLCGQYNAEPFLEKVSPSLWMHGFLKWWPKCLLINTGTFKIFSKVFHSVHSSYCLPLLKSATHT